MTTTHKTFTIRGKQPITEFKPNHTYAVEYTLDPTDAMNRGIKKERVGLIHTDDEGRIVFNYNIKVLDSWSIGSVDLSGMKAWKASNLEQEAAALWLSYMSSLDRNSTLKDQLRNCEVEKKRLELDLMYMRRHKLVRIAYAISEWIYNKFSF